MSENFKTLGKVDILSLTHIRKQETKLGEVIGCMAADESWEDAIADSEARFVLIGIPEDAGVKANHGVGGTQTAWPAFLQSFLNTQSNGFLGGEEILLLGYFDFGEQIRLIEATAPNPDELNLAYKKLVVRIDDQVEEVAKVVSKHHKIPIFIGGGHNNAYGIIKGVAKGLFAAEKIPLAQINSINLDAHTDYRFREGRHSGNGFRYADEDGYLHNYFIVAPHEAYLQQGVMEDIVASHFIGMVTYEDIFVREKMTFIQAVAHATDFTHEEYTGIELDLDCIQNTLSSAVTPCGLTPLHARKFLNFVATKSKVAYLHICEGAVQLDNGRTNANTGKLISYLVRDFVGL